MQGDEGPEIAVRPRLAVLVNLIPPYRVPLFEYLGERYTTLVLLSGEEDNRAWDARPVVQGVQAKRAWGWTLKWRIRTDGGHTVDERYLHITPGYLWELLRFRPNAIISLAMGVGTLTALLYGRLFRVPTWATWEGTIHSERYRSAFKRGLRRFFFAKVVSHWISYGETSTEYLASIGVPKDRILQIQNTVDERLYLRPVDAYPLDLPRPRALCVSQMIDRKNISQLLEVTATIEREGLEFSLVIVGDGPELERFRSEAERWGLRHICWIPHLPPDQMPSIYRACDFLVFPTYDDVWGMVVSEALLSGLPVIASTYAGCASELLSPENIFDPLDQNTFVETYRRAVLGKIAPPDTSRIMTTRHVADLINADIARWIDTGKRQL